MGYYMRFITTNGEIDLPTLGIALKSIDAKYNLLVEDRTSPESTDLLYGSELCAELEINRPGDGLFEEEIEELKESIEGTMSDNRDRVLDLLCRATAILAVRVLWQGREVETTLEKLDPLWKWLFANIRGILQADGEGYYDRSGLLLESE